MARRIVIVMAMVLVSSCSGAGVKGDEPVVEDPGVTTTTTTQAPPTTTTAAALAEASIGRTSTSVAHPPASTPTAPPPDPIPAEGAVNQDEAFWRRLADCECASGHCGGGHVGWFQFSADTAAKVGIDGSEGYEEQRAAAIVWAARIHPRENTRSGWPHCWDVAA